MITAKPLLLDKMMIAMLLVRRMPPSSGLVTGEAVTGVILEDSDSEVIHVGESVRDNMVVSQEVLSDQNSNSRITEDTGNGIYETDSSDIQHMAKKKQKKFKKKAVKSKASRSNKTSTPANKMLQAPAPRENKKNLEIYQTS